MKVGRAVYRPTNLAAVEREVLRSEHVREGLTKAVGVGEREAHTLARAMAYDEGDYDRSIKGEVGMTSRGWLGRLSAGGGRVRYAHIIEWGSIYLAPRAILRRAAARILTR